MKPRITTTRSLLKIPPLDLERDWIEEATTAHIHTLVMNGTITVNKPNTGRDIKDYLRSGKFLQFQFHLHRHAADLTKQEKIE